MYEYELYEAVDAGVSVGKLVFGLIILVMFIKSCVFIVPQTKVYIIERLGKYAKSLEAGLHVKLPFIERVAKKVSVKEQVLDFEPQRVITKDNVTMTIDSVVFMRVFDPTKYTYGVADPMAAIESLAATTLRNIVGSLDFDATLTSRDDINAQMSAALDAATDDWGIKVTRVEVKDIRPPQDIQEVMTKQMTAEREKRKAILESEAHKTSIVTRAEGDKQAKVLNAEAQRDAEIALAEGKAKSIRLVYEAEAAGIKMLSEAGMTPEVLELKRLEAMKAIADGNATKIFVPSDLAGSVIPMAVAGDALESGKTQPALKPAPAVETTVDPCLHENSSHISRRAAKQSGYEG